MMNVRQDQAAVDASLEARTVTAKRARGRVISGERLESSALPLALVLVAVIFGVLRPHTFLTTQNASSILSSQAVLVVVALALMLVIIGGDYDLSVASVVSL